MQRRPASNAGPRVRLPEGPKPFQVSGAFHHFGAVTRTTGWVGLATRLQSATTCKSHFLDRLTFFKKQVDTFADGHGIVTNEPRAWEDGYRKRWEHDKIVRSTHGVNCTGSCSWKIYVKGGIVTWETQQTDYPRTRPDLPNLNHLRLGKPSRRP